MEHRANQGQTKAIKRRKGSVNMKKSKLRRLREANGFSQNGLALELGVSVSAVIKWDYGTTPNEENRIKLAKLYGVDEKELRE